MTRKAASLVAFLSLLSLAACGGTQPVPVAPAAPAAAAPTPAAPRTEVITKAGDAKIGDTAKCPVSGDEFTVDATSPKSEHNGKTIYFCCGGCKKKFDAEPAKYLDKT